MKVLLYAVFKDHRKPTAGTASAVSRRIRNSDRKPVPSKLNSTVLVPIFSAISASLAGSCAKAHFAGSILELTKNLGTIKRLTPAQTTCETRRATILSHALALKSRMTPGLAAVSAPCENGRGCAIFASHSSVVDLKNVRLRTHARREPATCTP
jgi:hypothetical protein